MTNVGRIILLVAYLVWICVSIYGCTQVRIDFKVEYFIGVTAPVYGWFQLNDEYFDSGSFTTFYIDNSKLDYSQADSQEKIMKFNSALLECPDCTEKWYVPGTIECWYVTL